MQSYVFLNNWTKAIVRKIYKVAGQEESKISWRGETQIVSALGLSQWERLSGLLKEGNDLSKFMVFDSRLGKIPKWARLLISNLGKEMVVRLLERSSRLMAFRVIRVQVCDNVKNSALSAAFKLKVGNTMGWSLALSIRSYHNKPNVSHSMLSWSHLKLSELD